MEIHVTTAGRGIKSCGGNPDYDRVGCHETIAMGEIITRGIWFHNQKKWQRSWHFECWADAAVLQAAFSPRSYKIRGTMGRPAKNITKEERKRRTSLLVKASKLRKEKFEALKIPYEKGWMVEFNQRREEYTQKLQWVWDELEKVGGPPHTSFRDWNHYTPASNRI